MQKGDGGLSGAPAGPTGPRVRGGGVQALVHSRSSPDITRGLQLSEALVNRPGMDDTFSRELIYLRAVGKYRWVPSQSRPLRQQAGVVCAFIYFTATTQTRERCSRTCSLSCQGHLECHSILLHSNACKH